jgi:hydroxymethylpyrimidine pyrophosphatase-like HAD family hydrolase
VSVRWVVATDLDGTLLGRRLHHLLGAGSDKGRALRVLLEREGWLAAGPLRFGLDDAANDLPFLRIVDRPVIGPRPGGAKDPALAAALPHAATAPAPGPRGWNAAALGFLGEAAGTGKALSEAAGTRP